MPGRTTKRATWPVTCSMAPERGPSAADRLAAHLSELRDASAVVRRARADQARGVDYLADMPRAVPPAPAAAPIAVHLAGVLPGGRAANPKIHEADIPATVRKPDTSGFLARVRARVGSARMAGDVSAANIMGVARALAWGWRTQGGGARLTFEALGKAANVCRDTARRAVRWLEGQQLVDTVNVMARRVIDGARRLVLAANLYLCPAIEMAIGATMPPVARAAATLTRWAASLGLALRPQGFSRTACRAPPL